MEAITYTEFRKSLKGCLDTVQASHAPLHITRQQGGDAVLVSLEEYESLQETLHLLSSPRNAERLQASIAQIENAQTVERSIIE
jgi:antitoxin YefM